MNSLLTKRQMLQGLIGLAAGARRSRLLADETLPVRTREYAPPISDENGRVAYRFKAFASAIEFDLGENIKLSMTCVPRGEGRIGTEKRWIGMSERVLSTPIRTVAFGEFLLGTYPITVEQWLRVKQLPRVKRELGANVFGSSNPRRAMHDVVSHQDAEEFCARVSNFTGLEFRLPSEAEWEYSCRAGTETFFHFGDHYGPHFTRSEVVGLPDADVGSANAPNRFGLNDMHSVTSQWCADWEYRDYNGAPLDGSPRLAPGHNPWNRILRGSYLISGSSGRATYPHDGGATWFGFRVAATYSHGVIDPQVRSIIHGASAHQVGVISPGQSVVLTGSALTANGPDEAVVYFEDLQAPIIEASEERIVAMCPMKIPIDREISIVLRNRFQSSMPVRLKARAAAPGLFLATENRVNTDSTPAVRGEEFRLRGTGFGLFDPLLPDGTIATDVLPVVLGTVEVRVAEVLAEVVSARQAAGEVLGIVELTVKIPAELETGEREIRVAVGGEWSPEGVTLLVV